MNYCAFCILVNGVLCAIWFNVGTVVNKQGGYFVNREREKVPFAAASINYTNLIRLAPHVAINHLNNSCATDSHFQVGC
jgi:hypothetical protein